MQILDMDDIPYNEREQNYIAIIQDWGYTETGKFVESYVWDIRLKGKLICSRISKDDATETAKRYAIKNNIDTIYYSHARKRYFQD